jgi:hypothetical protein
MSSDERSILDLVEILMVSGGLSPEVSLRVSREIDSAFGLSARSGGSTEAQRARWRVKAARKRAWKKGLSPGGTDVEAITLKDSKTRSSEVKNKTRSGPPGDVPVDDGWPEDFGEQFWKAFPPYRRESKRKVGEKLARIRIDGKVPWSQIIGAVGRYAATDPGQFACAPMVWLNGERWDREYGAEVKINGGAGNGTNRNGNNGYATLAARLRGQGIGVGKDAGHGQPADGRRDTEPGALPVDRNGQGPQAAPPAHR